MSQNLMAMLDVRRDRTSQGWTFQGAVEESLVRVFCREENMVISDLIKVEATREILHKYPLLFDI